MPPNWGDIFLDSFYIQQKIVNQELNIEYKQLSHKNHNRENWIKIEIEFEKVQKEQQKHNKSEADRRCCLGSSDENAKRSVVDGEINNIK